MANLLTRRKQAWVAKRKPQSVRGAPLNNPSILEARFQNRLNAAVIRMCDITEKRLYKLFATEPAQTYFDTAEDASITSQARMLTNSMMKKLNSMFADIAPKLAEQQVNDINKASSLSVYESMKELSGGLSLPVSGINADMIEILNASTIEMTSLIKSISMQYLGEVQQATMRSITTGRGLADLKPFLQKHRGITERRATMIARDQTRKAYNNLNRGRMEKLGLKKFEWLHTGGSSHPRQLHVDYSGRIFSFDDPPVIDENTGERGIPGQAINCRCRMRPVIELGD